MAFFGKIEYRTRTVSCRGKRFRVEVADSFRKMAVGLMDHAGLGPREGMLFIFEKEGRYGFWMLNMKFSIDILWLDRNGTVIYIWENAEPCKSILSCRSVKPGKDSKYVIELRSGTSRKLGIKTGDRFRL